MMKGGLGGDTGTGSMCCGYGLDGKIFIRDFVNILTTIILLHKFGSQINSNYAYFF